MLATGESGAKLEEPPVKRQLEDEEGNGMEANGKQIGHSSHAATSGELAHLDSGGAWITLLLMFLINSSIGGASRVYGLIYAKQVAIGYYDHQAASWPIATASTVENLAGILTPALAQFLTWRQIQFLSTSLFVLANLGAYFSNCLALDILCLGLIQGLALSMSTVLALAINNDYFQRYRNTAYGLALCGGTCGILYMGPLINLTLDYSENFRLAYLVLALIFTLNYPLSLFIVPRSTRCKQSRCNSNGLAQDETTANKVNVEGRQVRVRLSRLESHFERKESVASISIDCKLSRQSTLSRCSCNWIQTNFAGNNGPPPTTANTTSKQVTNKQQQPAGSRAEVGNDTTTTKCQCFVVQFVAETIVDSSIGKAAMGLKRQVKDKLTPEKPSEGQEKDQLAIEEPTETLEEVKLAASVTNKTNDSDHFSLNSTLKLIGSPYLHCVWLMLALYFLVSRIMIIILADFVQDREINPPDSSRLLNYWSLGELCGRLLLCPFVDLKWLSVRHCITLTCGSLGATITLMVQLKMGAYYLYAGCLLLTAALASLEYVLINVLIIEYLGQNQVTSCYSIGSLFASAVLVMRPKLIGFFRDQLGSYDGLLILLAIFSLSFAILFGLLEPLLVRWWPKMNNPKLG